MFGRKKSVDKGQSLNVTPVSLQPWDMSGWLGRQGKRFHAWEQRFFILKGYKLYYYVNDTATVASGVVTLDSTSVIQQEKNSGKQAHVFSLDAFLTNKKESLRRKLILAAASSESQQEWFNAVQKACSTAPPSQPPAADGTTPSSPASTNPPVVVSPTTPTTTPPATPTATATTPPASPATAPPASPTTATVTTTTPPATPSTCTTTTTPPATPTTATTTTTTPVTESVPAPTGPASALIPTAVPEGTVLASQQTPVPSTPLSAAQHATMCDSKPDCAALVMAAHKTIDFLTDGTKMEKFWDAWMASIPKLSEIDPGKSITYNVTTSISMDNTVWRISGPQSVFAQKIVQFFWNMGSPMTEVDRMNDVGALINPRNIGSWIQTSLNGGMDGGWLFPAEIPLKLAVEAADSTEAEEDATRMFSEWADKYSILLCNSLSRDMGKSPPQQTEFRMYVPGPNFHSQFAIVLDAMSTFQFPQFPDRPLSVLANAEITEPIMLSIVTCAKGFVRLGVVVPHVPMNVVADLIQNCGGKLNEIKQFMDASGCSEPTSVELQCLMKGYGYGVYKEGFDILLHWDVGTETRE